MDQRISKNAETAKVASILMVAAGHFFPDTVLWVPVTVALFVFGFSSAFFTSEKYPPGFSLAQFWRKKVMRLGPDLVVINLFLLILFLFQGRDGIFTVHTILNAFGLTGLLNWFGIHNRSPFGDGLWFFTLLLIFYAAYPLICRINAHKRSRGVLLISALVATTYLHYTVHMGHVLWLTSFGFVFGAFYQCSGLAEKRIPCEVLLGAGIATVCTMLVLDYGLHIKVANYALLLLASVLSVMWLVHGSFGKTAAFLTAPLTSCVLEFYFIHSYLFVRPLHNSLADFVLTIALIGAIAIVLACVAKLFGRVLLMAPEASQA